MSARGDEPDAAVAFWIDGRLDEDLDHHGRATWGMEALAGRMVCCAPTRHLADALADRAVNNVGMDIERAREVARTHAGEEPITKHEITSAGVAEVAGVSLRDVGRWAATHPAFPPEVRPDVYPLQRILEFVRFSAPEMGLAEEAAALDDEDEITLSRFAKLLGVDIKTVYQYRDRPAFPERLGLSERGSPTYAFGDLKRYWHLGRTGGRGKGARPSRQGAPHPGRGGPIPKPDPRVVELAARLQRGDRVTGAMVGEMFDVTERTGFRLLQLARMRLQQVEDSK